MIKIKIDEIGSIKTVGSEIQRVEHQENMVWGELPKFNILFEFQGSIPESLESIRLVLHRYRGEEHSSYLIAISDGEKSKLIENLNKDSILGILFTGRSKNSSARYLAKFKMISDEYGELSPFEMNIITRRDRLRGNYAPPLTPEFVRGNTRAVFTIEEVL